MFYIIFWNSSSSLIYAPFYNIAKNCYGYNKTDGSYSAILEPLLGLFNTVFYYLPKIISNKFRVKNPYNDALIANNFIFGSWESTSEITFFIINSLI